MFVYKFTVYHNYAKIHWTFHYVPRKCGKFTVWLYDQRFAQYWLYVKCSSPYV